MTELKAIVETDAVRKERRDRNEVRRGEREQERAARVAARDFPDLTGPLTREDFNALLAKLRENGSLG
jgi:hypothetical protein